jgi:hypothetical protein
MTDITYGNVIPVRLPRSVKTPLHFSPAERGRYVLHCPSLIEQYKM